MKPKALRLKFKADVKWMKRNISGHRSRRERIAALISIYKQVGNI